MMRLVPGTRVFFLCEKRFQGGAVKPLFIGVVLIISLIAAGLGYMAGKVKRKPQPETAPETHIITPQPGAEFVNKQRTLKQGYSFVGPNAIADVAQSVSPSVVNIDVFDSQPVVSVRGSDQGFLFNGKKISDERSVFVRPSFQKHGTGSGLIIRPDGYILTNHHVVRGRDRIRVNLFDGRSFTGRIVGRDALSDLAVVKIPAENLPVAQLGNSKKLRPGQWAIAIGSPLGLDQTVTLGIISAIGRTVADVNSEVSFIQTDAAINPGNSGGPLVNLNGEVIGINSFVRSDAQNIGFATPIDTARRISQDLIATGRVDRAWVGIKLLDLTEANIRRLNLPEGSRGCLVVYVIAMSPGDVAGLRRGDIVTDIDGNPVRTVKDVRAAVRGLRPGNKVELTVLREGKQRLVPVYLQEMPENLD